MVIMFEVKMQVLFPDTMSLDDVRSNIKDTLDANSDIDLTHIRVKMSKDKCKDWIIDRDRKFQLSDIIGKTK